MLPGNVQGISIWTRYHLAERIRGGIRIWGDNPIQLKAANDIKADMERAHPMERLICGDVGYGKTEVAVRAAFKAATNFKQTAILVPTTILAQQHYETFHSRLKPFSHPCWVLSRFRTRKEQKDYSLKNKRRTVEIVNWHAQTSFKDIAFKDLGLVIVDWRAPVWRPPQGKIKELKKEVDVLTLTATLYQGPFPCLLWAFGIFQLLKPRRKTGFRLLPKSSSFREDVLP